MTLTAFIVAGAGAAIFLGLLYLLVRISEHTGEAKEKAQSSNETAIETKRQAEVLVERRTSANVVSSLRSKAAAKRKRQTKRKR